MLLAKKMSNFMHGFKSAILEKLKKCDLKMSLALLWLAAGLVVGAWALNDTSLANSLCSPYCAHSGVYYNNKPPTTALHRGAFCQFPFWWIYYCSKSIGKKTDKTHHCALWRLSQQKSTDKWVFNICCRLLWIKSHKCHNPIFSRYQLMFWLQQVFFYHRCFLIIRIDFFFY